MRSVVVASLFLCASAFAAFAEAERYVSTLLTRYIENCGPALTTPQQYVASVPNPGPIGNKTVSVSPDGLVVKVFHIVDGASLDITFARHPNVLMASCVANTDGGAIMQQAPLFDFTSPDAIAAFSRELAMAAQTVFAMRDDLSAIGGATPIDYVSIWLEESMMGLDRTTYNYSFILSVGDVDLPSILQVMHGGMTIYGARNIEIGSS